LNGNTLLFRQVHPSWVQDGQITSQVFIPTPKDQKMLSAYDGDLISAEGSWMHFTNELGNESHGVVAVSYEECMNQAVEPKSDPETFNEHVLIDYTQHPDNRIKKRISQELKASARQRGWLFRA
jgi:hypothetical protein